MRDCNPPETKQTFDRLRSEGHTKKEAMKLIGCALAVEIFEMLRYKKLFNESRYVENLSRLPEIPGGEEE